MPALIAAPRALIAATRSRPPRDEWTAGSPTVSGPTCLGHVVVRPVPGATGWPHLSVRILAIVVE
jgi:hypothetical protein